MLPNYTFKTKTDGQEENIDFKNPARQTSTSTFNIAYSLDNLLQAEEGAAEESDGAFSPVRREGFSLHLRPKRDQAHPLPVKPTRRYQTYLQTDTPQSLFFQLRCKDLTVLIFFLHTISK